MLLQREMTHNFFKLENKKNINKRFMLISTSKTFKGCVIVSPVICQHHSFQRIFASFFYAIE